MPASFRPLPGTAAWEHRDARQGFEVAFFRPADSGYVISGSTSAVQDGQTWIVTYQIRVDGAWRTRSADISGRAGPGPGAGDGAGRRVRLEADGRGHWLVDGAAAAHLEGCLDVDLESSAMTNTLPVHRLGLDAGSRASAPAAYVRAADLGVDRLEQEYARAAGDGPHRRYDYAAPAFGFTARLVCDEAGLVLDYPGIARRAR